MKREPLDTIRGLLENLDDWEFDRLHAVHMPTGLRFWIANSAYNLKTYESQVVFEIPRFQRSAIYKALKRAELNKALKILQGSTNA